MMRLGPGLLLALTLLLVVLGCGGKSETTLTRATSEGPIGEGASGIWIYRPAGEPKDLVVFLHGQGGASEAKPDNHLPWINHLVSRGSVVVYPRYELDYEADPMPYIVDALETAEKEVDLDNLPVVAIGYSRGGGLAVEYGAVAAENDVPVPDAIIGVLPAGFGNAKERTNLSTLPQTVELLFMVGDQDTVVGGEGAAFLSARLRNAGFPGENVHLDLVESRGDFVADHFAAMQTTPAARAAFWQPTDAVLDALAAG
jgi:poly(3-hydroxybutyrate) depolymerase